MYSNIFSLILVMLMISLTPIGESEAKSTGGLFPTAEAFFWGMIGYLFLITIIFFQSWHSHKIVRRQKERLLFLVNLELLSFLFCFHFLIEAPKIFGLLTSREFPETLLTLFSLSLYFGGVFVFHFASFDSNRSGKSRTKLKHATHEILLLAPFVIPFLFLTFLFDLINALPGEYLPEFLTNEPNTIFATFFIMGITLFAIFVLMIFLPYFIQKIWNCESLEESSLKHRLEELCRKAHFKQAGLRTWTVLNHALTAAIIGIVPRFRYVMFTKRILREFPETAVEAILAHEIGHSYRKHLLLYPLIIFGITIVSGIFFELTGGTIQESLVQAKISYPSPLWDLVGPIAIFIPYALIMTLYFRYVFGFFSRQFERQADLHVFELQIPPKNLIEALDLVGKASGNSHRNPNWHHYSIQQRMDFLQAAEMDPQLIEKHHRKVKRALLVYLMLLCLGIIGFIFLW